MAGPIPLHVGVEKNSSVSFLNLLVKFSKTFTKSSATYRANTEVVFHWNAGLKKKVNDSLENEGF